MMLPKKLVNREGYRPNKHITSNFYQIDMLFNAKPRAKRDIRYDSYLIYNFFDSGRISFHCYIDKMYPYDNTFMNTEQDKLERLNNSVKSDIESSLSYLIDIINEKEKEIENGI